MGHWSCVVLSGSLAMRLVSYPHDASPFTVPKFAISQSKALSTVLIHVYKQQSPLGAKKCSDVCPRTLSLRSCARAKLEENCELVGTDKVQGQVSEHIFKPNGDYCGSLDVPQF